MIEISYMHRLRELVKIVADETDNPTDALWQGGLPDLSHCLHIFQTLDRKYDMVTARRTLAIATGNEKYIRIKQGKNGQTLQATSEGLKLLTFPGYLNALGESINKLPPIFNLIVLCLNLGFAVWSILGL